MGNIMPELPNPGSDEALDLGCTCPVLDNGHGRGCGMADENGKLLFWYSADCKVHCRPDETRTPA